MCVVSMVGDHYKHKWEEYPWKPIIERQTSPDVNGVNRHEFEKLKQEVQEMKELLKRAVKYDEDNHEPHCETEDKMKFLKLVADAVGVSLDDVIAPAKAKSKKRLIV